MHYPEIHQQILRNRSDPRGDDLIEATIRRLFGIDPAVNLPLAQLAEIIRRGLMELGPRRLARLQDDHRDQSFDPLFKPLRKSEATLAEP